MNEQWQDIPGYEGVYAVSNFGRVKRYPGYQAKTERLLKPRIKNSGYLFVTLTTNNRKRNFYIHSLVARAFIGERPPRMDVNHKDGIKTNNCADNLEFVSRTENMSHARQLGLHDNRGERQWKAKLTEEDVLGIRYAHDKCGLLEELPDIFGVDRRTVLDVLEYKTWRHV